MQAALRGAKRPSGEGELQEDENGEPKKPKTARKAKAAPKAAHNTAAKGAKGAKVAKPEASSGSAEPNSGNQEIETSEGGGPAEPSKTKPDLSAMWHQKD